MPDKAQELFEFCKHQIETNGFVEQSIVAVEEASEYTKELCKFMRGCGNRTHLIEEMADVVITLSQMMYYFGVDEQQLDDVIDYKIRRASWRK